jgi:glutamine cyclotransferase
VSVDLASSDDGGSAYLFHLTWSRDSKRLYAYRWPGRQIVRVDPESGRLDTVLDVSGR